DGIKEGGGIAGHSEIHPVYDIKILDKVNGSTFNESNPTSGNNNLLSNSSLAIKNRDGGEQENSD
ncbi:MAG: hypothetical protein ACTHJ7_10145, partial [Candidatus Nitrosocosmicus sp.]